MEGFWDSKGVNQGCIYILMFSLMLLMQWPKRISFAVVKYALAQSKAVMVIPMRTRL